MPTTETSLWGRWKVLARRAAEMQSNALLFILYYVAFLPIAVLRKPFANPIHGRRTGQPAWLARNEPKPGVDLARRQF